MLKNKVAEMKNSELSEKRISELKNRTIGMIQYEEQKEKNKKQNPRASETCVTSASITTYV